MLLEPDITVLSVTQSNSGGNRMLRQSEFLKSIISWDIMLCNLLEVK